MGFRDVALMPPRASFSTTFLKNYGRGESLGTSTCLMTVVGVSKAMLPVKYFCNPFLFQSRSYDCYKDEAKSGHSHFGDNTGFKTVVSACLSMV